MGSQLWQSRRRVTTPFPHVEPRSNRGELTEDNMTDRNTLTMRSAPHPVVQERAADLRLYRVGATEHDGEFYVRCADLEAAADAVVQRAHLKKLDIVYRPIVEVTSG